MPWSKEQTEHAIRCKRDPIYFLDTFAWMDSDYGIIPFNMGKEVGDSHYYQRETLQHLLAGENVVLLKNRRAGLSWLAAAYIAWGINFNRGWNALLLSKEESKAINLLAKVKFILKNLAFKDGPTLESSTKAGWLTVSEFEPDNQQHFGRPFRDAYGKINSTSSAISLTTTKKSGIGEKAKFVFIDEVQFIENQDEVFGSVLITAALNGIWMMGSNAGQQAGTRFHHLCLQGRAKENKSYWYREVWPWESGITQEIIDKSKEAYTEDIARQEWYLEFGQPGNAVFNATHLAACYKPPDLYPEVKVALDNYRQEVIKSKGRVAYYVGVDSAVGKTHKKSNEKDFNFFTVLTYNGIQAFSYYDKKPLSHWAGETIQGDNGPEYTKGKVSELHAQWPGLALIEEEGPGYVVLNRYVDPQDGVSEMRPVSMKQSTKNRIIKNLIIAIESHAIVITDEKTYQQLSVYEYGETPDTYGAPLGMNDDAVIALALALDGLTRFGGFELTIGGKGLDHLILNPTRNEEIKPSGFIPQLPANGLRVVSPMDSDLPDIGALDEHLGRFNVPDFSDFRF